LKTINRAIRMTSSI